MGSFNSQYENYYNSVLNKKLRKSNNIRNSGVYRRGQSARGGSSFIVRRVTQELCGALILFVLLLGCRAVVTPQTKTVYSFCQDMINKEYDYWGMAKKVRYINLSEVQDGIINGIEKGRCKITGEKTVKERVNENFKFPAEGKIVSKYGDIKVNSIGKKYVNRGVDIQIVQGMDIKTASNGKVKKCMEDEKQGKYIIIDHGGGVETVYSNLEEIYVNENDEVLKDDTIAKGKDNSLDNYSKVHFELLYMGEDKDPQEFISMGGLSD